MKQERIFAINKMFAGDYLDQNDSQNIGHEIVNLFSDDEGDNYIYLNPGGAVPEKYDEKIEYVFLTKYYCPGCQELLGIAKVGEQLVHNWKGKLDDNIKEQVKKYKDRIKYFGQPISKIYRENHFNGRKEGDASVYLTFKTEEYYTPNQGTKILLTNGDCKVKDVNAYVCKLPGYKFGHQSLRFYISNRRNRRAFSSLEKLLAHKDDLFVKGMPSRVKQENITKYAKDVVSYLEVMGKIDSENIYSNLIAFFLRYDGKLLSKFCRMLSKDIKINPETALVDREKHGRTDIWIEDENNVIVIENKIDAGLSQENQLENYRDQAKKEANGRKISLFLIMPNSYDKLPIKNGCCENFSVIRYSQIHKVFSEHKLDFLVGEDDEYIAKMTLYYEDFTRALGSHGETRMSSKQLTAERLFHKRIYQLYKKEGIIIDNLLKGNEFVKRLSQKQCDDFFLS